MTATVDDSPSDDPLIGQKLHLLRRKHNHSQKEVAEFLTLACGRSRSTRWVSSVEKDGGGVIYRDEVAALEGYWNDDFSKIRIVEEFTDRADRFFVSDPAQFFQLQQNYLSHDTSVGFELWFTNPANLLFLHETDARDIVADNIADGTNYCFLWPLDTEDYQVFEDFLIAVKRVSKQLLARAVDPAKSGRFHIHALSSVAANGDQEPNRLVRQYKAEKTRTALAENYKFCVFHPIQSIQELPDGAPTPDEMLKVLFTRWVEEISFCLIFPKLDLGLVDPEVRPVGLLQFEKVACLLEDFDVSHEGKGWLLMSRKFADERAEILRRFRNSIVSDVD